MGDVLSLVEKAEEKIKKEDQESVMESLKRGKLWFFQSQLFVPPPTLCGSLPGSQTFAFILLQSPSVPVEQ